MNTNSKNSGLLYFTIVYMSEVVSLSLTILSKPAGEKEKLDSDFFFFYLFHNHKNYCKKCMRKRPNVRYSTKKCSVHNIKLQHY